MVSDDHHEDDEPEWPDMEDDEDQNEPQEKGLYNVTGSDYDAVISDETLKTE